MARYVAFLRAVNLGRRKVPMAQLRNELGTLGYDDVATFVNSGNAVFTAPGQADDLDPVIEARLEAAFGFEVTTCVRTADEVAALAADRPFGEIAAGHTHMVVLVRATPTKDQRAAAEALSNDMDTVTWRGRDIHWLVRGKVTDSKLATPAWERALGKHSTTARNTTMLRRLLERL